MFVDETYSEFSYKELTRIFNNTPEETIVSHDKKYNATLEGTDSNIKEYYFVSGKISYSLLESKFSHCKKELKFHISLPETEHEEERAKGWDIIKYILINRGVNCFKIIRHGIKMSDVPHQRGKDITIYTQYNPKADIKF